MKIKIIKGGYGHYNNSFVTLKDKSSEPFDVEENEANRLVALGIAEIVSESKFIGNINTDNTISEEAPYGPESSISELRKIGKEYGLTFKVGTTKEQIIEALNDIIYSATKEIADDELPPGLSAADPV